MTATATAAEVDATRLAHRAIVAATVLGVVGKTRPSALRVRVGVLGDGDGEPGASADLIVMTDRGVVDERRIAAAWQRVRLLVGGTGVAALVVGSPVTAALADAARGGEPAAARDDAYARAMRWAARRERSSVAPAVAPSRLALIVDEAEKSGLTLVEPDIAVVAPGLARVLRARSPRARAMLLTIALGVSARPLLFVPSDRAPKAGLGRAKVERLVDGWVAAGVAAQTEPTSDATALVRAALDVLDAGARDRRGPMSFKALLREARERWTSSARESGGRATPSAQDATELAAALYRLATDDRVELSMLDPAEPALALTPLA